MKLLVITNDYKYSTFRQGIYFLLSELNKLVDLVIWTGKEDNIQNILAQLKITPDFILIWEYFETKSSAVTGLSELSIPYAISLHDLHCDTESRIELIRSEKIKNIISIYRDAFYEMYPDFTDNMYWFPHHANTNIFKDYKLPKDINYLLMGEVNSYYPLRQKILKTMNGKPGFVYHPHPGYRNFSQNERILVRKRYAREINRAKIFFTCDSILHYPVSKYYEIPACKTLLLAPTSKEIENLGFIPGVHFVDINEDNFVEKAEYYLTHEKERMKIAKQGYKMVRKRHSTEQRAADLVEIINKIINSDNKVM